MPTKARSTKKKRPSITKRTVKKTVAKVKKKVATKKPKGIGKVVHYFDRIQVAIIELKAPVKVGDTILFKRGEHEHAQVISSMQIDHMQIEKAKKGDVIGVRVTQEIRDGSIVLPA